VVEEKRGEGEEEKKLRVTFEEELSLLEKI
jgi:hypothetical protein